MAGNWCFEIEQGATFSRVLTWKDSAGDPIDLTGYTARMQLRQYKSSGAVILELTTGADGRIALGGAAGTITLEVDADDTAEVTTDEGVYDLELVNGDVVTRLLEGQWKLNKEVTR